MQSVEIKVRAAERRDVSVLTRLLDAYRQEIYASPWRGTAEALARDGRGREFHTHVATIEDDHVIGFVTWTKS